jgi:ketosteroid isomerase-like protein
MRLAALPIAFALAGCGATLPMTSEDPPVSLAAAETAFAAHSVREDMRVAFMAAFDEGGVFVRNGWVVANDFLRGQPEPPIVLDWRPVYTEVARSGELGLSTGPWKITSKAKADGPPAYGQFVSIWRRVGKGPWRVAVDLGIGNPSPALWDAKLVATPVRDTMPAANALAGAEARFASDAAASGLRAAHARAAAEDLRFYRMGHEPLVGKAAALASSALNDERLIWTAERAETARSGDFGYARGRYAAAADPSKPLGWYLRVWRAERGEWRVILDVTNPAPPPRP